MTAFAVIDDYRRGKTALFLAACGGAGAAPHWLEAGKSLLPAITLAGFVGGYGLRTGLNERKKGSQILDQLEPQSSLDFNSKNSRITPKYFSLSYLLSSYCEQ